MTEITPPNRRGRPHLTEVDRLRVRAWFTAVSGSLGYTAKELEYHFISQQRLKPKQLTSIWRKYEAGETTPGKGTAARAFIKMVERQFKNTEYVYWHPLWTALEFNEPLSHRDLHHLYIQLPDVVADTILYPGEHPFFWRRPVAEAALRAETQWDAIHAIGILALLVRDAEISQDGLAHREACLSLQNRIAAIKASDFLHPIRSHLLRYVVRTWEGMTYPTSRGKIVAVYDHATAMCVLKTENDLDELSAKRVA